MVRYWLPIANLLILNNMMLMRVVMFLDVEVKIAARVVLIVVTWNSVKKMPANAPDNTTLVKLRTVSGKGCSCQHVSSMRLSIGSKSEGSR